MKLSRREFVRLPPDTTRAAAILSVEAVEVARSPGINDTLLPILGDMVRST